MGDNDNSGLIIGLIVGAVIALILLSKNDQQTLSTRTVPPIEQQIPNWQPMDIPRVDDIKPQQPPQA